METLSSTRLLLQALLQKKESALSEVLRVPLEDLHTGRLPSPRLSSGTSLARLIESIAEVGLLNPLTVVERSARRGGGYEVLVGHRRLKALQELNRTALSKGRKPRFESIPVHVIRARSSLARQKASCALRVAREDLNIVELGKMAKALTDFGLTQREAATVMGRSQGWVCKVIAVAEHLEPGAEAFYLAHAEVLGSKVYTAARQDGDQRQLAYLQRAIERLKHPGKLPARSKAPEAVRRRCSQLHESVESWPESPKREAILESLAYVLGHGELPQADQPAP